MPRRLLNIASIVCLVLCVALMGMWVRSYYWTDEFDFTPFGNFAVGGGSAVGRIVIGTRIVGAAEKRSLPRINHTLVASVGSELASINQNWSTTGAIVAGFGIMSVAGPAIMMPYWFAILLTGALSVLTWFRVKYRFSLRTLFIATTLLAVVLGMMAWLDRAWIGR